MAFGKRGRPPSAKTLVDRQLGRNRKIVIPTESFIIPNHSGDHSAGNVQKTPTDDLDIPNKKYVDDSFDKWDDLQVAIGAVGFGSSAPSWTAYKGGEVLAFNPSQNNSITFTAQIPHSYEEGTDLDFHLHLVHPTNPTGEGQKSKWTLTYSWAKFDEAFPSETTLTKEIDASMADLHKYEDVAELDGTGKTISSILICSLTRNGTDAADTYTDDVYLVALDFHFKKDSNGSTTERSK